MSAFDSGTEQLLTSLEDRVFTITFNRPDARNALSDDLTGGLRRALKWAETADEVGAIVLTGAGGAFCAGGDVKNMNRRNTGDTPPVSAHGQFLDMKARHNETAGAIRASRKPSIAALPGAAAGAGLALALSCDMRIGAERAFVSTGYARIGLSGDYGVAWLLTRVIGPARARELMLTADRVASDRALALGLFNEVVPDDELMNATHALAKRLANGPMVAYGYIKDNLNEALDIDHATAIEREADRLVKARTTSDHREAVSAFVEKRDPSFTGN
ncbi:MAG: enoyl-CoA hydratase [Gammaproteobacteria bacterium]|nr:enoyl-CoA hydratase [Gammaproteobacteria bacterium]